MGWLNKIKTIAGGQVKERAEAAAADHLKDKMTDKVKGKFATFMSGRAGWVTGLIGVAVIGVGGYFGIDTRVLLPDGTVDASEEITMEVIPPVMSEPLPNFQVILEERGVCMSQCIIESVEGTDEGATVEYSLGNETFTYKWIRE